MTMTTPFLLITLHLSHIFLTDALTFIFVTSLTSGSAFYRSPPGLSTLLFISVDYSTFCRIIRCDLDFHLVAGQNTDIEHTHLSRNMTDDVDLILQLHTEHGIGQLFSDDTVNCKHLFIVFGHNLPRNALLIKS